MIPCLQLVPKTNYWSEKWRVQERVYNYERLSFSRKIDFIHMAFFMFMNYFAFMAASACNKEPRNSSPKVRDDGTNVVRQ
jgi:hypothetical protein